MTLHGDVPVNAQALGGWTAQRLEPITQPDPDTVCRYHWRQWRRSDDLVGIDVVEGEITHRYGDGPELLAAMVLVRAGYARDLNPARTLRELLPVDEGPDDEDDDEPEDWLTIERLREERNEARRQLSDLRATVRDEHVELLRSLLAAVTPPTSDTDQGARVGLISALYAIDPDADLTPAVSQ
jgi:hypothetical protein